MAEFEASVAAEKKSILSLADEIIASVARLCPLKLPPKLEQLNSPIDNMSPARRDGYNHSLLLLVLDVRTAIERQIPEHNSNIVRRLVKRERNRIIIFHEICFPPLSLRNTC